MEEAASERGAAILAIVNGNDAWYNMSTWRGFYEPSASNACPLSESEPQANDEFSGHGIIWILSILRGGDIYEGRTHRIL